MDNNNVLAASNLVAPSRSFAIQKLKVGVDALNPYNAVKQANDLLDTCATGTLAAD